MSTEDEPNVAVLAREVCGHTVPQLVLVRGAGDFGPKMSAIGAAVIVHGDDPPGDFANYHLSIYADWYGGSIPRLRGEPSRWLIVPLLIVRTDHWDEYWITLVDKDGYQPMTVARHHLTCEINGHQWTIERDEHGARRCVMCGGIHEQDRAEAARREEEAASASEAIAQQPHLAPATCYCAHRDGQRIVAHPACPVHGVEF